YSSMKEKCSYMDECNMPGFNSSYTSASPTNKVGSNTFHDMQVGYKIDWMKGLQLTAGLNNVFDKDPPICLSCSLHIIDT
ncbi:hypothetical protein, partial [Stenotrophomonas sp. 3diitr2024]|uniref:hypothetical protein n=1 Tax=Stenotrophomonas sp. 3diitr2024 TaxID=3345115 RepID=UPI0035CA06CF